jgi:hypothetical protein
MTHEILFEFRPSRCPSCYRSQSHYLNSKSSTWSIEMQEHEPHVFTDADIEILPPETVEAAGYRPSSCACCGKIASIDEDCYGICEECLGIRHERLKPLFRSLKRFLTMALAADRFCPEHLSREDFQGKRFGPAICKSNSISTSDCRPHISTWPIGSFKVS